MQTILFFVSCSTTFLFYCLVTSIILKIYAEKASWKRRFLFAFCAGTVLNNLWTYGVYLLGGMLSFSPTIYALVTVPNPVFAMLIYLCGVKILRLSPFRSLHIMNHSYTYYMAIKILNRFIGFTFFAQTTADYNYMLDAFSLVFCAGINILIYYVTIRIVNRFHFVIKQGDQLHIESLAREIVYSFLRASFAYGIVVALPRIFPGNDIYLIISFILALFIVNGILSDRSRAVRLELSNKETYINNLVETVDRFRGVKHDINNMLMSYEGYIELGDLERLKEYHRSLLQITSQANSRMDLAKKIQENPALVSLINAKLDYAESCSVKMDTDIVCNLDMSIDNVDVCRSLACLLDNAIEAAAVSPQRMVLLSIERKPEGSKLFIVKNSTRDAVDTSKLTQGVSTKEGHSGMGISQVRRTLGKYGNCSLNLTYFDHSFTAYMVIMKN